jgi:hypothetical protein
MAEDTGLWRDARGQYHARIAYAGVMILGTGTTAVDAFAACWEAVYPWVSQAAHVSDASRPGGEDVS